MTYSLVGMCRRTGMFGAAVTTSNMNVGTRCPFAKASVGAVLTQHRTDNRLGPKGLALLEDGKSAPEVIGALVADNPTIGWRQLAVVDRDGGTGFHHGDRITSGADLPSSSSARLSATQAAKVRVMLIPCLRKRGFLSPDNLTRYLNNGPRKSEVHRAIGGHQMTFSLVGMCRRTGMFGAAVTTSNMNVGTRCPFAKASVPTWIFVTG